MIHATIETSDENAPTVNSEESHHTYRNWTGYPSLIDSTVSKASTKAASVPNANEELYCTQPPEPY